MKTRKELVIYLVLLLLVFAASFVGMRPLLNSYRFITEWHNKLEQTQLILNGHVGCIAFSDINLAEKMDLVRDELGESENFLGLYPYPDLDLFHEVYQDDRLIESKFIPFEYNSGLDALGLVKIKEGELFQFKDYTAEDELPVVVTENAPFNVGDRLTLHRGPSIYSGVAYDTIQQDAVVVGIAYNNIALPFSIEGYAREYHKEMAEAYTIYLPEQHGMQRHIPQINVKAYALFSSQPSLDQYNIVGQYGVWDYMELFMEVLGGDEEIEYLYRRIDVYLIPAICFAVIAIAIVLTVLIITCMRPKNNQSINQSINQ
ncbi:MAG: hypothetical protein LBS10_09945 [Gracilibacteraceae bacterium]|nr:hypothetical protein [Gracilibacteraceae bacterium]